MQALEGFVLWFWISLIGSVILCGMWMVKTFGPVTWLRWANAESAFWRRVRLPASIIHGGKKFEQSRGFAILNGLTCLLYLLVTLLNAGAYLQFRQHLRDSRAAESSIRSQAVKATVQAQARNGW